MQIKNKQTILFIGDSITDCGRRMNERPLGCGYVKLFNDLLIIRHPQKKIKIINKGIGGQTIVDLRNRWQDDVLRQKPDWLVIKIGINDLHQTLANMPEAVNPVIFKEAYNDVLSRTKAVLPKCRIALIAPFYLSTETDNTSFRNTVLKKIPEYLAVVESMSKQYNTLLLKPQSIFQKLLKNYEPDQFCQEPVHPNLTGHLVLADAVYNLLS